MTDTTAKQAGKKEEEKGAFKIAGGKLPSLPDNKPALDPSKGFGVTKPNDNSNKGFNMSLGFGKGGFGGTTG